MSCQCQARAALGGGLGFCGALGAAGVVAPPCARWQPLSTSAGVCMQAQAAHGLRHTTSAEGVRAAAVRHDRCSVATTDDEWLTDTYHMPHEAGVRGPPAAQTTSLRMAPQHAPFRAVMPCPGLVPPAAHRRRRWRPAAVRGWLVWRPAPRACGLAVRMGGARVGGSLPPLAAAPHLEISMPLPLVPCPRAAARVRLPRRCAAPLVVRPLGRRWARRSSPM